MRFVYPYIVAAVACVACFSAGRNPGEQPYVLFEDTLECARQPMRVLTRPASQSHPSLARQHKGGLHVLVTDMYDRTPLAGAIVELAQSPNWDRPWVAAFISDSTGRGDMAVPAGTYYLRVTFIGYYGGDSAITIRPGMHDSATVALSAARC